MHGSPRRHHVSDEDIAYAYRHALTWVELDDDPQRYLLAGPDRAGNVLELVVLVTDEVELVLHAMALRDTTRRELFGKEGRR